MTNEQIDSTILFILFTQGGSVKGSIACTTVPLGQVLDNALERLKRKGKVHFMKGSKKWFLTDDTRNQMFDEQERLKAHGGPIPASVSTVNPVTNEAGDVVQATGSDVVHSGNQTGVTAHTESEDNQMSIKKDTTDNTNKIDAAINAARQRKEKKVESSKEARPKLTAEEKEARDSAREAERAQKKAEREQARASKKAEKDANKPQAHMRKVEKAESKLPKRDDLVERFFSELTTNFSASQITSLAAHLTHFNRVKATERALAQKVEVGSQVRIIGGDIRFVGKTGTVAKVQRIRCYVEVEGAKKPIYLFTSDVEVLAQEAQVVNG